MPDPHKHLDSETGMPRWVKVTGIVAAVLVAILVVLLLYTRTLGALAVMAGASSDLGMLRTPSVLIHTMLAFVLLVAATVLAVYKPRGRTRHGRRTLNERRPAGRATVGGRATT